jgi:hypothetical protein
MRGRQVGVLLVLALLAAACGSGDSTDDGASTAGGGDGAAAKCPEDYQGEEIYPIFISSEVTTEGEQRFQVGLLDENDAPFSSDSLTMQATFEPVSGKGSRTSAEFQFIETVPSQNRGVYVGYPSFDATGVWAADLSIQDDGVDDEVRGCFEVTARGTTPAIGEGAPSSDVPTRDDVENLMEISTDDDPNPRFYSTTPAEAIKKGDPFVLVFATPKYCTSQVCGPTLDEVARVVADYPDLTVIHTEIYEDLEPTSPVVPAVEEWGLPSEPWVFVVDSKGLVAAKYEGSVSDQELRPVLDSL